MNKIIDYKQCTVLWNDNDLKTSHVEPAVFFSILAEIDAEYGRITKMTIMWGNVHRYLRMTIYSSSTGKLIFLMVDYIGNMLDDIPEDMKGESATPDAYQIFDIAEDTTKLSRTDENVFHHFEARLLYILGRAHKNIHL